MPKSLAFPFIVVKAYNFAIYFTNPVCGAFFGFWVGKLNQVPNPNLHSVSIAYDFVFVIKPQFL